MSPEELARRMADTLRSTTRENRDARASALLPFATALLAAEEALGPFERWADWIEEVSRDMDSDSDCDARFRRERAAIRSAVALIREALR